MTLTIAKLGKIIGSNLRTLADTGDWRTAARRAAEALDPQAAPTPPPVTSGPLGGTGSWKKMFEDTFDGTALNLDKWRRGGIEKANGNMKPYNDTEQGFYSNSQVSVANGNLALTAINRPVTAKKNPTADLKDKMANGGDLDIYYSDWLTGNWPYQSGTVTTAPDKYGLVKQDWKAAPATFDFLYGWVEARIKLPKGRGLWPAFWLLPTDGSWSYEVDILEQVDPTGQRLAQHLHANNGAVDFTKYDGLGWPSGVDLTADYHTYAVNWTKDKIQWLVDGKVTQETSANVPNVNMYLLLNLAVGGSWPGNPDSSTPFPSSMLVDWVRVWSQG